MRAVRIRMLRACLVAGAGRALGEVAEVPLPEAHEAVASGWAEYVNDADADAARAAFVDAQLAALRALDANRGQSWTTAKR